MPETETNQTERSTTATPPGASGSLTAPAAPGSPTPGPPETLTPPTPLRQPLHAIATAAACVALAFSGLLAFESLGNAALPGCGESGKGCFSVLNSPYAKLLGLPVSWLSVLFYAAALVLLWLKPAAGTTAQKLLFIIAGAAATAALYFTSVQAFVLQTFCAYCCAAHAAGFVMAKCVLLQGVTLRTQPLQPTGIGVAAVLVFAGVQAAWPTEPVAAPPAQRLNFQDTGPGPDRQLTFPSANPGTGVRVNPHKLPIDGDPDAPVVALLAHDYTCGLCSVTHQAMKAAKAHFGDQLAVAIVPVARSTQEAQGLRDLALSAYLIDPDAFLKTDDHFFHLEPGQIIPLDQARAFVETLVDPQQLETTLASETLADLNERYTTLHQIAGGTYPLLIIQNNVWAGTPVVEEAQIPEFLMLLEKMTTLQTQDDNTPINLADGEATGGL